MNKTLQEQLIDKGLVDTRINKSGTENRNIDTKSIKSVRKERLSERELRELMGTNRDTFKRHRGSVRRR